MTDAFVNQSGESEAVTKNADGSVPVKESSVPLDSSDGWQEDLTSTDTTSADVIKAGVEAKVIYVENIIISTDTAMNIRIQDEDDGLLLPPMYFPANSIFSKNFGKKPLKVPEGKGFEVLGSATGNVSVFANGYTAETES